MICWVAEYSLLNEDTKNLVKPTVKDIEKQAKDGKAISIIDFANAIDGEKSQKKPSVLESLKRAGKVCEQVKEQQSKGIKKAKLQER